jgi:hypothetical protein
MNRSWSAESPARIDQVEHPQRVVGAVPHVVVAPEGCRPEQLDIGMADCAHDGDASSVPVSQSSTTGTPTRVTVAFKRDH